MLTDISSIFQPATVNRNCEYRLTRRVAAIWTQAARNRLPDWKEIRQYDLGDDWNWVFAVDLEKSSGFPYFMYLGNNLGKLSDVYLADEKDWSTTLLEKAVSDIETAVRINGLHFVDSTVTLCDGRKLLFRSMTAPLSRDGKKASHVMGAANGQIENRTSTNPEHDKKQGKVFNPHAL